MISNPTVAAAAAASRIPVTGKTTSLSVLGANIPNASGESSLSYTWAASNIPNGATSPTFSINGTNAAKNTTATFSSAGTYIFTVTISDSVGNSVSSSVTVQVNLTLTTITVSPTTASLYDAQTTPFTATAKDQFGVALTTQPTFTWTVVTGGVGSVGSTGIYSSPAYGPGTATVQATSGTAAVTVILAIIDGTSGNDTIRLVRSGANLLVYLNNPTTPLYTVPYSTLGSLAVAASTGNDSINVDFSGGATPVPVGNLFIDGSDGTDTLIVTGTTGNDTAAVNANTVTFNGSVITYNAIEAISINGSGGTDVLTQNAQPGNSATPALNGVSSGGPSATDTLNINSGTYTFLYPTTGGGIQPLSLASLSIASGSTVTVPTSTSQNDRWVLTTSSLTLTGSTSKLDLGGNDLILHNANASSAAAALSTINGLIATG